MLKLFYAWFSGFIFAGAVGVAIRGTGDTGTIALQIFTSLTLATLAATMNGWDMRRAFRKPE